MTNLRRRFILFCMLVISAIMLISSLLIMLHAHSDMPDGSLHRWLATVVIFFAMVFIGSWLISRRAVSPIKEAWKKQLEFTAAASHELRTPLAALRANLELVLDCREETVASQMKWLENMDAESRRMTRLIDDLLTLARADAGRQELLQEEFSLGQAAGEVVDALTGLAGQKGIRIELRVAEEVVLHGDRNRIKQLVMILLDNAIRYSGASVACVAVLRRKDNAELMVRDDGCGIGAEHLDRLFERFYRVTEMRSRNPDGSGLGLSIARWIAEEHGGTIAVHSAVGRGTEFTVALPAGVSREKK
ncbi:sensor histidine kinase [Anaerovibrio sp.]|uniref:sensor histidine kinase n=1 Tax=Anaerovibrio sp. TaxID=1872532 RepID=UPI003F183D5F